jgi:hypothetical protein
MGVDKNALLQLAIEETPTVVAFLRSLATKDGGPEPTDAEVMEAFESAFQSSRAKDEQWLAAHPEPLTPTT